MWPTIVKSQDVPGINMICADRSLATRWCGTSASTQTGKTLHNTPMLLTWPTMSAQVRRRSSGVCLWESACRRAICMSWFPFQTSCAANWSPHPQLDSSQPLPVKWGPQRKFVPKQSPRPLTCTSVGSSHEHPHFVIILSLTLIRVVAKWNNIGFGGGCCFKI